MSENVFQFEIPAEALLAVAPHLNSDDTRPWTKGILCEARGPNACVVATDGRTLAAYNYDAKGETGPDKDVVLFGDWRTIKKAGKLTLPGVHFRRHASDAVWEACCFGKHDTVFRVEDVDAQYPSWRQVVPRQDPKAIAGVGADWKEYAPRFANFGKTSLQFFGEDKAIVIRAFDRPELLGLLMPLMTSLESFTAPIGVPHWAETKGKASAAA